MSFKEYLINDSRQWSFLADMNQSGAITISDTWLWFKWIFFYPGDFLFLLITFNSQGLAGFFEISTNSYGGFFSGLFSLACWLIFPIAYLIDEKNNSEAESKWFWPCWIIFMVVFFSLMIFMDKHGL